MTHWFRRPATVGLRPDRDSASDWDAMRPYTYAGFVERRAARGEAFYVQFVYRDRCDWSDPVARTYTFQLKFDSDMPCRTFSSVRVSR